MNVLCFIFGHRFRRARKREDANLKYCKRKNCPHSVAVVKRVKIKETT